LRARLLHFQKVQKFCFEKERFLPKINVLLWKIGLVKKDFCTFYLLGLHNAFLGQASGSGLFVNLQV
jgi:hypothetical protein